MTALFPDNRASIAAGPRQEITISLHVVERSALVAYTPAQMYALVNDVARYPEFLPWCTAASVEADSPTERVARVEVSKGPLRTSFTTRNALQPDTGIHMRLVDGPFKQLVGRWEFDAIGDRGSRIKFRVDFEFKSRLTAMAFDGIFENLCGTVVDAFVQRARSLYGEAPGGGGGGA